MNPYITGFPVAPQVFVGRNRQQMYFQRAVKQTRLSNPVSPQNIAIMGNWGIGKTSLLNKCLQDAQEENILVVKVTLSPEKCKTMEDFAVNTVDALYQSIWHYDFSTKVKSQLSKWKIDGFKLLGVEIKKTKNKSPTPATILTNKIKELWDIIKNDVSLMIIAYDDLHYLSKCYANGLYDLRAIFQDTREAGVRAMLVVTGDKSLFSNIRGISEPLVRFFEQIHLGTFSELEAKECLKRPLAVNNINLKFEKKVMEEIFQKTEQHPYFITFFAHDLFEYKSAGRITIKLFQKVYPEILEHLAATRFINDIAITNDTERKLLDYFCRTETLRTKDVKGVTNPSMAFKRLEEKNLIKKVKRGYYQLYHTLFREYLTISSLDESF
ncbi:type IV toxin-antitoxin system AbiEi family antitoxin domain-containing protein [Candidatus Uabimicrobium amorphum]|uniref:KAP NTPase domain-containing protein n=1 Tax=Uabimicrobium amorphum TaxID=2596890 RepID=A0A5S9INZ7_UABAM|nr:P-loop NTPase fold protein [Candidatus Uabimicrobium amorphum]BBM84540.1 hypothetical protein UABAM_02901 [Candidatus Uabimicrobium amorphum]